MNTQITQHENILKHKYKHSLYENGKAVRQKNGFRLNNAPAPETSSRMNFSGARKNEYRDIKSPSNVSFGGLSSMSEKLIKSKKFQQAVDFAGKHNSIFTAASVLVACGILRPTTIMLSSNVEMENRKIAACKSIASGLISFVAMYLVSKPIEHALKLIETKPAQYLKNTTIKTLSSGKKHLQDGKAFSMASRTFKMCSDLFTSPLKGSLTIILIPPLLKLIFGKTKPDKKNDIKITAEHAHAQNEIPTSDAVEKYADQKHYVFFKQKYKSQNNSPAFKGSKQNIVIRTYKGFIEKLSKAFGKFLDLGVVQKKAVKYGKNKKAIETTMTQISGTIVSAFYVINTLTSKKIEEYRKKPLMYNATISWAIATFGALVVDKVTDKKYDAFCDKYKAINKHLGETKLAKHASGLKIMKSAIIVGAMYRWITPWIATIFADKVWKLKKENKQAAK